MRRFQRLRPVVALCVVCLSGSVAGQAPTPGPATPRRDSAQKATTGTGLFALSGNVKEWTLAHVPGENPIRGGASNNTGDGRSCPLNFTLAVDTLFFPTIGFRCCW